MFIDRVEHVCKVALPAADMAEIVAVLRAERPEDRESLGCRALTAALCSRTLSVTQPLTSSACSNAAATRASMALALPGVPKSNEGSVRLYAAGMRRKVNDAVRRQAGKAPWTAEEGALLGTLSRRARALAPGLEVQDAVGQGAGARRTALAGVPDGTGLLARGQGAQAGRVALHVVA